MSTISYDKILSNMKTVFFNETGKRVEDISDIGARFQAVASELYSISCFADFVLKQAFPQTATANYLDSHARLRSIERQSPSKATGTLIFYVNEPLENDIEIPQGVVCSQKNQPYIQFVTTQPTAILAGELTTTVSAQALSFGTDHNVDADEITVMVNPPLGVNGVTNQLPFEGGMNEESDYSLRKRILESFKVPPMGINIASYKQMILKNPSIVDCYLNLAVEQATEEDEEDVKTLCVYLRLRKNDLSSDIVEFVRNVLYSFELCGIQIEISQATAKPFDLIVQLESQQKSQQQLEEVENEIFNYVSAIKIGEHLNLSMLTQAIARLDGVTSCEAICPNVNDSIVYSSCNEYLSLANLKVGYYE